MTIFKQFKIQNSKFKIHDSVLACFGLLILISSVISPKVSAASFDFNPASNQFLAGCRSAINIDANANSESSNAADIEIRYNPNEIDILDSDPNIPGTQIKSGNAYETYFGNDVDTSLSRIRLAGASFVGNLSSKKTFATIEFKSKTGVTSTSFQIKFDGFGATLDSNIADSSTSDDLLKSVTNGNYTFRTDFCEVDREPPKINNISPKAYDTSVAANSKVTVQITDNQSGVDLSNTIFYINNDTYSANDPAVTYTGSALNYTFIITPRNAIPTDAASTVRVTTKDLAGNASNNQIIFNIPASVAQQIICPAFNNPNGASGITGGGASGNTIPLTGGTIRTGGYSPELINTLKDELNDEKSALSLLNSTPLETSFINSLLSKPIINGLNATKTLEVSLKAFQYFSFLNLLILILALLNLILSDRKREIRGYAINNNKAVVAGAKIELYDLVSLLKEGEYYSENDGEYIFKVLPGSYEVRFVDQGTDYMENVVLPETQPVIFLNKKTDTMAEENKYIATSAQLGYVLKLGLARIAPGILLAGILLALLNLIVLSTWFNIIIFTCYIAVIGTFWIPKLIRYTTQVLTTNRI